MKPIKLTVIIIRETNHNEILELVEFARNNGLEMRVIEYMDVGKRQRMESGKKPSAKEKFSKSYTQSFLSKKLLEKIRSAPAVNYEFLDGAGEIGFIRSVTEPFCSSRTRIRLTADGELVICLLRRIPL